MGNITLWMLISFASLAVFLLVLTAGAMLVGLLMKWASWKRLQIRKRAEWTYENPYWQEAFAAGVKWADEGKPPMRPFLGELRMPKHTSLKDTPSEAYEREGETDETPDNTE